MKNKLFSRAVLIFVLFFSCSKNIKFIEIIDDSFLFSKENYSKTYEISSNLDSLDIGISFNKEIKKEDLQLGSLEVTIIYANNKTKTVLLDSDCKFFYSEYNNQLVNKINFRTIDLEEVLFVKELILTIRTPYIISSDSKLFITNINSRFFFDE